MVAWVDGAPGGGSPPTLPASLTADATFLVTATAAMNTSELSLAAGAFWASAATVVSTLLAGKNVLVWPGTLFSMSKDRTEAVSTRSVPSLVPAGMVTA